MYTAIDRLTSQHPQYVTGLADALQHDMSVVSAEVQSLPPQPLSPFADYFLHTAFNQSVRLLLQRYIELTALNATNSHALVAIARGTATKRTVHPFDLLRLYSALRDSVAFGCSVYGVVVSVAVRAVIVDVWSMLFKGSDAWQRIHAGSWVSELSVSIRADDKLEEAEEEEEGQTPPATNIVASTTSSASSGNGGGEKRESAVMPTLVASTDSMGPLSSILGKRRSSANNVLCDTAYEAEGEDDEPIEDGSPFRGQSSGDEEYDLSDAVGGSGWGNTDAEPGADADIDDADMLKTPTSPRSPTPPPLTTHFSPAAHIVPPRLHISTARTRRCYD